MKTMDNLATAFAGESQATRKYLMFAEQADKEGYKDAARLFRAAAKAEMVHSAAEFKAMGGLKSTAENLQAAIGGETYEFSSMYPPMIEDAEAEGQNAAKMAFIRANEAEKVHAELYTKELEALNSEDTGESYYVCPICGYIHKGKPEGVCPICKVPVSKFEEVK